jgi:hypothetical protein
MSFCLFGFTVQERFWDGLQYSIIRSTLFFKIVENSNLNTNSVNSDFPHQNQGGVDWYP